MYMSQRDQRNCVGKTKQEGESVRNEVGKCIGTERWKSE